jgi:hypothetical protein
LDSMHDDDQKTAAALAELLRTDPSYVRDPDRLSRALLDLLPYQPRTVRLLALGAALGVPAVSPEAALDRLIGDGGLQPDVAAWILAHFRAAISGEPFEPASEPLAEPPGQPTGVRLGVWPDGQAITAVISASGIYATTTARTAHPDAATLWRRVATPSASSSRDAAVVLHSGSTAILWSDVDGIHASDLKSGASRLLLPCVQPRYPLAALACDQSSLDVLWTTDREVLRHSLVRAGLPTPEPKDVSFTRVAGERLKCLDLAQENDRRAWLTILTDHGRLLVAQRDLMIDDISAWSEIAPPTDLAAASIVQLADCPTVIVCTPAGHLLSIDAKRAFSGEVNWRSVDRPSGLPAPGGAHALSAASSAGGAWLAVSEQAGTWLARLAKRGDVPVIGGPHRLQL